ncbi:MAG: translation elongation factor Ts, partial [Acutalibacteraceae bacterium]
MAFTAKDVQALREKTGVGMMDCKKALVEADGDMDKAVDLLREKGLASAAKKATRVAAEGVVAAYTDGKSGALVEINCETDFVAKGEPFVTLANKVVKTVVNEKPADVDALLKTKVTGEDVTVEEAVQEVFLSLRENMKVRRFALVEGKVATYIHAGGTVGVMVQFDTDDATAEKAEFAAMGKNVAMQVAAMNPAYLDEASVPAEVLDHEKEILVAQMKEDPKMANKPEAVLTKIVEGKVGKYYKENCLLNQEFVRGDLFEGDVKGYVASVA